MANPTGKGGFGDHPEHINKDGAPQKDISWAGSVRRLTSMTRDELIAYVGPKTRAGKLLKELSPNVSVKESLILAFIIQFGREPTASMFNALADREDGKVTDKVDVTSGGEKIKGYVGFTPEQWDKKSDTAE